MNMFTPRSQETAGAVAVIYHVAAAAILPHAMMLGRIRTIYAYLSGPGVAAANISIVIYLPFCLAEAYLYVVLKLKCCLRQTFIGQLHWDDLKMSCWKK